MPKRRPCAAGGVVRVPPRSRSPERSPAVPYPPQPTSITSASSSLRPVVLGVDLTSAGARPGAHRARGPLPPRPFDGERFLQLVRTADRGLLDLITLDEDFLLHPGRGQVTARLDTVV